MTRSIRGRSRQLGGPVASLAQDDAIRSRLDRLGQRYTPMRKVLVASLALAGRPLTVPEIVAGTPALAQSSAYRNITALIDAGVVRRIAGTDDHGRFELAEELSGHHHHLVCATCGSVADLRPSDKLERVLGELASAVANDEGYEVIEHRLDLVGRCPSCRSS